MSKLEFLKENHSYKLGKEILISTTQAIKELLGDKYQNVPDETLRQASEYGTKIHELIEKLEKGEKIDYFDLTEKEIETIEDYKRIKSFESKHIEHLVHYKDVYAGTVDGIGDNIIYDIKTTATVDYLYVSLQLSLYLLAYDEKRYNKYKAYILHFPKKERAKKIRIELLSKKEVLEVVERIKCLKEKIDD